MDKKILLGIIYNKSTPSIIKNNKLLSPNNNNIEFIIDNNTYLLDFNDTFNSPSPMSYHKSSPSRSPTKKCHSLMYKKIPLYKWYNNWYHTRDDYVST
tara:strand:- start:1679 stop:1972 length:294 start_codon:yes stop_codon:yes gene_type:complete